MTTSTAAGAWPPGPRNRLTGWSHLYRMSRDPLAALSGWQRAFGDVVHLRIWPERQIVVTDPQLAREWLLTHHDAQIRWERGIEIFSRLHGHSVLIAEGEQWRAKRQALQASFTRSTMQAFVPTIVAAAGASLSRRPDKDTDWPIESALTSLSMDVIMRMVFSSTIGKDARITERAVHAVSVAANGEFYWPASWPDSMPWKRGTRAALATLKGLVERHLQTRLKSPAGQWPGDLLSRLLRLHLDDPLAWPLDAVHDECMTAFLAGHETVAATLSWWAWCMASNPQAQRAARDEVGQSIQRRAPVADDLPALAYLTQTLQETMRRYPAVPILFTRRSTKPVALGPWQLPARTLVMLPVLLMHHDARWFPDPMAFLPDRFGPDAPAAPRGAYLPFGAAPRVCLGQHLAMTEMTMIAAMLLQRFELTVPSGMPSPTAVVNVTLRADCPMHLRLVPVSAPGTIAS